MHQAHHVLRSALSPAPVVTGSSHHRGIRTVVRPAAGWLCAPPRGPSCPRPLARQQCCSPATWWRPWGMTLPGARDPGRGCTTLQSASLNVYWGHVQLSSVAQSRPTLCDPVNRSTPGLPVHHQLPEFAQTHVHRVGDAIRPSHPLSSLPPSIFPSIRVFSNESALRIRWPKYWSFSFSISPSNEHSGLISSHPTEPPPLCRAGGPRKGTRCVSRPWVGAARGQARGQAARGQGARGERGRR